MPSLPEPSMSPRLERLLRLQASRVPPGLADRVFQASAPLLPASDMAPHIIGRLSFRWLAAAAALAVAAGAAFHFVSSTSESQDSDFTLAVVIEDPGDAILGEELFNLTTLQGTGLDDFDAEMQLVLAEGGVDG